MTEWEGYDKIIQGIKSIVQEIFGTFQTNVVLDYLISEQQYIAKVRINDHIITIFNESPRKALILLCIEIGKYSQIRG